MNHRNGKGWRFLSTAIVSGVLLFSAAPSRSEDTAKPWVAPPAARQKKNPVKSSPDGLAAAAKGYHENCAPCHGAKGAGDGDMAKYLKQKPANFADAKMMNAMTDGELFWKMTEGRPPMPPWKDQMTETERWQMVNYLRTLVPKGGAQK